MDAHRCCAGTTNWTAVLCGVESTGRASRKICNRGGMAAMGLRAVLLLLLYRDGRDDEEIV